ncbi:hypothetical protein [Vibrio proteolyticus]
MSEQGEYYLHENGSLIYKPHGGVDPTSAFVKGVWAPSDFGRTPAGLVEWFCEVYALGANRKDIERFANSNSLESHYPGWSREVFGCDESERIFVSNGKCIHGVSTSERCTWCDQHVPF